MSEISPILENARLGKLGDERLEDEKNELAASKLKYIADQVAGGANGEELLSGAIPQQLGIVKGNLGNCMKKLLTCKFYKKEKAGAMSVQDLGEGQSPEEMDARYPKHTAMDEDRIRRGVPHPAAEIKAKPATEHETKTATEDYVHGQSSSWWALMPYEPGFKMAHDRMTNDELEKLVHESKRNIKESKAMTAKEFAEGKKAVEDANKKAMSAMTDVLKAAQTIARSKAAPKTADVLKELAESHEKLIKCVHQVKNNCIDGKTFPQAAPAAALGALSSDGKSPMGNPDDHPDRQDADDDQKVGKEPFDPANTATTSMNP